MPAKLFAFSALAAALAVSGCSSTGGGGGGGGQSIPQPSGPSLGYNAVVISGTGGGTRETGRITGDSQDAVVQVAGDTYRFGNGSRGASYAGIDSYSYGTSSNGAALYLGEYTAAAILADEARYNQAAGLFQGERTPTSAIPNQQAQYDGFWNIAANNGGGANGRFAADFDFSTNTYAMGLVDANGTRAGQGSGNVNRSNNTFEGDLETTGSFVSTNDVYGAFFGPDYNEVGGNIAGNSTSGGETTGVFVGAR
ncbi:hypothetical protein [Pelagibacterium mangrovi]|uniref:hypothetical protein n=1 Tax=Pelagibacterium mangrovi TaxID=3119828 RepID=UPI002FC9E4C3